MESICIPSLWSEKRSVEGAVRIPDESQWPAIIFGDNELYTVFLAQKLGTLLETIPQDNWWGFSKA